uniref:Uncharacterized protein n=1 Tax=Ditylenchus dipsaci TaxID=166011 RepID=A0A915DM31_9BILA
MFNLSVVYMMYQPDHWCQIPGMNDSSPNSRVTTYGHITNHGVIHCVPKTKNKQRDVLDFHSQCHYYDRGTTRYEELRHMSLEDAQKSVNNENRSAPIVKCQKWEYDQDVMKNTIVTEWNLVCDDNFKRAHAHLFYSFGFLFGCLLGGFASDRFGRKPTVIGFGILSSMFGLILHTPPISLSAYVLCMEITGTRYRAMVGSLLQAVGYATLALIAYFCKSWQYIQLITAALHTISICLICVLPESPRWLIVNNRQVFSACDLELVKHAEQRKWVKRHQRANILHLLKSRALCVRTGIICIVWIATALVYYGLVIALSDQSAPGRVLFSGNFFVNNAIAGAIELPTLLVCVYLMKYGRKRAQIHGGNHWRSPMLALCSIEMYPTVIRNSAVGFCSMIARLGSGVSSYVAILSDVTLAIVPMIIFATFSLFAGMLVMLLPETRDQPLPDTLQDAVTFLKNNHKYECYYGFGGGHAVGDTDGKQSMSGQGEEDSRLNVGRPAGTTTTTANTPTPQEEGVSQDGPGFTANADEDIALATADATSISRKRSDTFNELPSIPEVPDHCEEHNLLLLDETGAIEKEELAEILMDNNKRKGDKQCTPTLSRQRHRAGAGNRKVSTENLIRNLSNADSLLKDLTDISIPDKLNEPFD